MSDVESTEIEFLEMDRKKRIIIVCPNPGRPHKDTVDSIEHVFEPMKKYSVEEEIGNFFCNRAQEVFTNQHAQMRAEKQEWAKCTTSPDMAVRVQAEKFADKTGVTVTQPPPRPGLVRFEQASGKAFYDEGLREMKNPPAESKPEVHVSAEAGGAEMLNKARDPRKAYLDKPSTDWEVEQKMGYIEKLTGTPPPHQVKGMKDVLDKRMFAAFEAQKKIFDNAGVEYVVD